MNRELLQVVGDHAATLCWTMHGQRVSSDLMVIVLLSATVAINNFFFFSNHGDDRCAAPGVDSRGCTEAPAN